MIKSEQEKPHFVPALIVIDMQNDFVSGSLPVPGGASIIESINALIDLPFKAKIATRDFHPEDHVSFANTHNNAEFSKKIIFHPEDQEKLYGFEQVLWPVHCVANSEGSEFVPGLNTTAFDDVIHKGTHPKIESYSAFRDIWGRGITELPDLLTARGITDLYFVGLAGDYCVKYTAIDSAEFGFRTWVVKDAIKSISDEEVAFQQMKKKGIQFTTTEELKKLLGSK